LSTNVAENSVQRIALGRKNWIHIGCEKAGTKVAAIVSMLEICRRLGVPVREYLLAVLTGMADPLGEKTGLTPMTWKASKANA
jgi:transposase